MRPRRVLLAAAVILAVVAAPAAAGPPDHAGGPPEHVQPRGGPHADDPAEARSVVAAVDTFTNPYHEFFQVDEPAVTQELLDELGVEQTVTLTHDGDYEERYASDEDELRAIPAGEPVWFEGTNLIGVTFEDGGIAERLDPEGDPSPHGVGVTAAVLTADPDAIVVSTDGISEEAEAWAFRHPAVDAVNTSYGTPVGEPDVTGMFGPAHTFEGVVERGKHHFGAVANAPTPAPVDETGGPWWTISVAGHQEGTTEGRQAVSGTFADFAGDFTQELPYCHGCLEGTSVVSGTSFASPRSMGTFAAVLRELRTMAGHAGGIVTEDGVEQPLMVDGEVDDEPLELTNWQLRRALEEAAVYPGTEDYDPAAVESSSDLTSVPALDPAPWSTYGWGTITTEAGVPERAVDFALDEVGVAETDRKRKPDDACDAMTAQIDARMAYWNQVWVRSDSAGEDGDEYIRC